MYVCVDCLSTVLMLPSLADLYLKVWSFSSSFSVHIQQETPYESHPAAPSEQSINQSIMEQLNALQFFGWTIFLYLATHFVQVVEFLNMLFQLCKQFFIYTLTVLEPLVGTHLPVQFLQEHILMHIYLMHIETCMQNLVMIRSGYYLFSPLIWTRQAVNKR